MLRYLLDGAQIAWVAIKYLFPVGAAAMTAYFASLQESWHLVIFYTTGVFAFCTMSVYATNRFVALNSIFERLRVDGTEPILVAPNVQEGTVSVVFKCMLHNTSPQRTLYFRLEHADSSLQGKTNSEKEIRRDVTVIPPFSRQAVQLAAVPNLDIHKEVSGQTKLVVRYGPKPNRLIYRMTYETDPVLEFGSMTEDKCQMTFLAPVSRYEHERSWWIE